MRTATTWHDYEILDAADREKLERWGDVILIRPDPQIIWNTPKDESLWQKAAARYIRSSAGGGAWEIKRPLPKEWNITWNDLIFKVSPTGFKHTGLFPEQAVNWQLAGDMAASAVKSGRQPKILNLFAYTGASTAALLKAGASVCHVDAAKGMIAWAKENLALSGLADKPVRFIVDDCRKFAEREIRRGSRYDGVILDPPSYGRGPGGEVWKLEDTVYDLLNLCAELLSDNALFVLLNSYTTGLSPGVMEYLLAATVKAKHGGSVTSSEIGLPVKSTGQILPCGNTAVWLK